MNRKKYIVTAIALTTVLLAFAASLGHYLTPQIQGAGPDPMRTALSGPSGKFGPEIETVLTRGSDTSAVILDLETGRALIEPPIEYFNSRADASMAWIRSRGLDISCRLLTGGAACTTYDMLIVPVKATCWQESTEAELLNNPALAPVYHSPRRLLVFGHNQPDTYIFRTAEGTVGMLRLVGLSQHEPGITIRYKLINPPKPVLAAKISSTP